jgi:hypothetical protein
VSSEFVNYSYFVVKSQMIIMLRCISSSTYTACEHQCRRVSSMRQCTKHKTALVSSEFVNLLLTLSCIPTFDTRFCTLPSLASDSCSASALVAVPSPNFLLFPGETEIQYTHLHNHPSTLLLGVNWGIKMPQLHPFLAFSSTVTVLVCRYIACAQRVMSAAAAAAAAASATRLHEMTHVSW